MALSDRLHETGEHMPTGMRMALSVAAGALVFMAAGRVFSSRGRAQSYSDAPGRTMRRHSSRGWREHVVVGRTVTINRPREELYAFWRDFKNLPQFMENVRSVEVIDDKRSRWTIAGPADSDIEFETMIAEDRPNELIAWRSHPDASVRNSGRIVFRDAQDGRGTEVEATIAYDPPAGAVGRLAAKVFQREPAMQARRELKRFKQLMETGEVATAERRRPHPETE